jgi:spore coat polysaccharide biosynthesis protein SpsF
MVGASGFPPRFVQAETDAASDGTQRPENGSRPNVGQPNVGQPNVGQPKIVGVIQARVGSTRLPGKVLLPVNSVMGRPLLELMLERVAASAELDEVVVATTEAEADEPIRALCARLEVACFSGHPTDCLDRHWRAGRAHGADAVVKIPSDCPLIDPRVIDLVVGRFRRSYPDRAFVGNLQPPTWPDGNDVEVMRMDALEQAFRLATRGFEREHTTPFIWDQPERFTVENVVWPDGRDLSASHRLTLDYREDYLAIAEVFGALYRPAAPAFSVEEIVEYLDTHPDVRALNVAHLGSSWMSQHATELNTLRAPAARSA